MTISDRDAFLSVLYNGPMLKANAAVVLCGEDARPRAAVGVQLLKAGAADLIVLSGGKHAPPRWVRALQVLPSIYASDVAPDRVVVEPDAMNTREQAVNVLAIATQAQWTRLLLVASPYHAPRAFLTFLKVVNEAGIADTLRLSVVAVNHLGGFPWSKSPDGMSTARLRLLSREFQKIDEYRNHVATYAEGLAYLAQWEARPT